MSIRSTQWFSEALEARTAFSVRVSGKLFDRTSTFQRVEIFDSEAMGRFLVLDHCFMVTEKDHFVYHEMLVHPAMAVAEAPRSLLIIGGGDGGAVTEAVRYPSLESITLCEIDPLVVSACREYLPEVSAGLDDPRVTVIHEDGAALVRESKKKYDVILVDSTDPVGPGTALFEAPFYESIKKCLTPGGVAVFQTENPLLMQDIFTMVVWDLVDVFGPDRARTYLATIPSYPGALWTFTMGANDRDPHVQTPREAPSEVQAQLRYYNSEVHRAAFALPVFVKNILNRR
ncbi:MAG: polyamine aminopropyltransferase [Desulfomonilaceae bacterium]|nr:polyamine aminopropyltransferase [Desulfomonilaceae bacterium]